MLRGVLLLWGRLGYATRARGLNWASWDVLHSGKSSDVLCGLFLLFSWPRHGIPFVLSGSGMALLLLFWPRHGGGEGNPVMCCVGFFVCSVGPGMAVGRDLKGKKNHVISVIGTGP